jgi:hypothetical protein
LSQNNNEYDSSQYLHEQHAETRTSASATTHDNSDFVVDTSSRIETEWKTRLYNNRKEHNYLALLQPINERIGRVSPQLSFPSNRQRQHSI